MRREGYSTRSSYLRITSSTWTAISSLHRRSSPGTQPSAIFASVIQPGNIIVSKSSDFNLQVISLTDWQYTSILHTSILPLLLLSNIPQWLQNYDDPISQKMTRPSLPKNLGDSNETQRSREKELHRRRLIHYHYVKYTEEYNKPHYTALTDPVGMLRRCLFCYVSDHGRAKPSR